MIVVSVSFGDTRPGSYTVVTISFSVVPVLVGVLTVVGLFVGVPSLGSGNGSVEELV